MTKLRFFSVEEYAQIATGAEQLLFEVERNCVPEVGSKVILPNDTKIWHVAEVYYCYYGDGVDVEVFVIEEDFDE